MSSLIDTLFSRPHISIDIQTILSANTLILIVSFLIMDYHNSKAKSQRFDSYMENKPVWERWGIYYKLALFILMFGVSGEIDNYYNQF